MKADDVLKNIQEEAKYTFLPIIGPQKGQILVDVVRKHKPKNILEVGTLVGYSAILMSQYLPKSSRITTIEINPEIAQIAQKNFRRVGVERLVNLKVGNAIDVIPTLKKTFNLLFLDAAKEEYFDYLKLAEPKLTKKAVVIADNVGMFAEAMADYLDYVRNSPKFKSKTVDFGFDAVEVSQRV